jgi:hypothetical protein
MADDLMAVLELHPEHRVGQQFHHLPAHLQEFFFRHKLSVSAVVLVHGRAHSGGRGKRKAQGAEPCGNAFTGQSLRHFITTRDLPR